MEARTGAEAEIDVDDGAVGVYLHLPFCERICPYCDFAVVAARRLESVIEADYVAVLCRELSARKGDFAGRTLASLYLGGGTPSLFQPGSIQFLKEAVDAAFPSREREVEVTLELNPGTLEESRLPAFREAGVNRLSIGVQSFDDAQLKRLGRAHRVEVVETTLALARGVGFDNLSIDLIFAAPGQDEAALDRDLDALLRFGPEHVSTYELTWEPGTPFGRALAEGRMTPCDEDRAADMIGRIEARMESEGYERYEISSYARPGFRARHNARYWQRQAVLGLGMGAHSTEARTSVHPHGARRANPRELAAWRLAAEREPARCGQEERIDAATARGEAVFLALRQREGLSARRFEAEFGGDPRRFFSPQIEAMAGRGWLLEEAGGDLRLSPSGRLFADSVAAEFVGAEEGGAV